VDRWIQFGFMVAGVLLGMAVFLWWRRRRATHHYLYDERAALVAEALAKTADLGLLYWSRSQKKFLRRVVTPLELNGHVLKAFDHTIENVRVFRITAIREARIVPRGGGAPPSLIKVVLPEWSVAGAGLGLIALCGALLWRTPRTTSEWVASTPTPPQLDFAVPARADTTEPVTETETGTLAPDVWTVVLENDARYDAGTTTDILQRALHCTSMEAEQLLQKARDAGKTTVWQGPWHKAEEIRQTLEAEDLLAEVEQVGAD
jgi:ATP-dependent Clp protease adapter protein ClpS